MHELFIGGEGLARGGRGVLGTLLHEAAHGAANARGIQDTSRQGRYHNAKFKVIAESFGLTIEHGKGIGWSLTTVPDNTAALYAAEVVQLDAAVTAATKATAKRPCAAAAARSGHPSPSSTPGRSSAACAATSFNQKTRNV